MFERIANKLKFLSPFHKGFVFGICFFIFFMVIFKLSFGTSKSNYLAALVVTSNTTIDQEISKELIAIKRFPPQYYPKNAITPKHANLIMGKILKNSLERGTVLRWNDFQTESSSFNSLTTKIPEGYRAFPLQLTQGGNSPSWIKPGDRIDILGNFSLKGNHQQITKTLFQNILVLKNKPQLVLLVTPEEAELLLFSKTQGTLYASLRNQKDQAFTNNLPEHEFRKFLGMKTKKTSEKRISKNSPQFMQFTQKLNKK